MKYMISFFNGDDCVVEADRDDIVGAIRQAIGYGCGTVMEEHLAFQDYYDYSGTEHGSPIDEEDFLDFCADVEIAWFPEQHVVVDIRNIEWRPVPPNTVLGPLDRSAFDRRYEPYRTVRR